MERFIATRSSREVRRLMSSVAILDFAVAAISLFEPIYLYTLGFSLIQILLYYAAIYVLYLFLLPLGGKIANNLGFNHVITLSSPFLIAYYLSLFAIKYHPLFMILAIIVYPVQKILYWPGYHSELSRYGDDGERGREISNISSLSALVSILGPLFGGVMIAAVGFPALFAIAGMLILASNIPLMSLPEKMLHSGFKYGEAFKRLASHERRRDAIAMLGYGEELLALVIWPIFIYVFLKGYVATGALVSASILLSTIAVLYIGRIADLQSRHAVLRTGVIFTAASWIVRLFIRTSLGLLGVSVFYGVSRSMLGIPFLSLVYSRAGRSATMETIIFFEMSLAVGKILTALLGVLLLLISPNPFAALFILAAVCSSLFALIS